MLVDAWFQHRKHSKTVTVDALSICPGLTVLIYLFKGTEAAVVINSAYFDASCICKAQAEAELQQLKLAISIENKSMPEQKCCVCGSNQKANPTAKFYRFPR